MRLSWGGKEKQKGSGGPVPLALCWAWQELPQSQKQQEERLVLWRNAGSFFFPCTLWGSREILQLHLLSKIEGKKKVAAAVPGYWEDKIQALYSPASGGLRLSMNLLLQACDTAGSAVQEAPWVWSLDSISVNISPPKPLASLGPNDTMVLDPSKAATSSVISESRVPPGCPWELSVSLQLGLFSCAGVCCCCSKNKMTV